MGRAGFEQSDWRVIWTFLNFFYWKELPCSGDVTYHITGKRWIMQPCIQSFPHGLRSFEKYGILVENYGFSTFSTGLSTRVFHSQREENYALTVYISRFAIFRHNLHFLQRRKNYHTHFSCAKLRTWQIFWFTGRKIGKNEKSAAVYCFFTPIPQKEKILKKVLILWNKDAIM